MHHLDGRSPPHVRLYAKTRRHPTSGRRVLAGAPLDFLEVSISRWFFLVVLASCHRPDGEASDVDGDGDGLSADEGDCDDNNLSVFPGAAEVPYNGIDDDCAGGDLTDVDDDGYAALEAGGDDCDDQDATTYPGAPIVPGDGAHNDCAGGDRFEIAEAPPADILFVVDDSCSMDEEQRRLRETIPSFVDSLQRSMVDWHVGITTTDTENGRGRLVRRGGASFADGDLPDAVSILQQMTEVGMEGSSDERGRRAAWMALTAPALNGENAGFRRDEADLHIVVLSDEPDYSGQQPSGREFVSFLNSFRTSDNRVTFSSIVGPRGGCPVAEPGAGYIEVTQTVGGYLASICDTSWDPVFDGLHDELTARSGPLVLSEAHVPGTLRATATEGAYTYVGIDAAAIPAGSSLTSVCAECSFTLTHIPEINGVVLSPRPIVHSQVVITYDIP